MKPLSNFQPRKETPWILNSILLASNTIFFPPVPRVELRTYILSHFTSPLCVRYFRDSLLQTVCLGWFRTVILLISASWVARITGVSPVLPTPLIRLWHWVSCHFLKVSSWKAPFWWPSYPFSPLFILSTTTVACSAQMCFLPPPLKTLGLSEVNT
jgi:hypothetical protein